jgi:putative alpha-1,2-mannosidase
MSARYIFTALGFYPVTPASDVYAIGRPFVRRATIHLSNGHAFTVSAEPLDGAHPWVGAVTLNGKPLDRTYLRHAEILAGGELHFTMQAEPNRSWGADAAARPGRGRHDGG